MSKRESNKIDCRERILKASRRLFTSKGYEETMMEDIAQRAQVSKATVYNYFPNKESLLIGTADDVIKHIDDLLIESLESSQSGEEKLRRVLEAFVQASLRYPDLARRITYLNSCESSALYATSKKMIQILRTLILEAQAEGTFRHDANPDDMVDVLMGLYFIAQFQWPEITRYTQEHLQERLGQFFTWMMAGFYTPGKAPTPPLFSV
ncbi:MAG: TetR/AcrR family transcriptional regulator [Oscillospiraceae bacterium]|nr:TetR/AcrR family transcriptional regulator [Oscillospiraceae bacterium]